MAENIIIALGVGGHIEYEFESLQDGNVYIYCRVMDVQGGGQSWIIVLNGAGGDDYENIGMIIDTPGEWVWGSGRNGPVSPTPLKKGMNTIRVVPREASPGHEPLMDIIAVSTVRFEPTDEAFNNAAPLGEYQDVIVEGKTANPDEQFTVDISAWLKENQLHHFTFDLKFDPAVLQAVHVKEGAFLSNNGAMATIWREPEVDNEKGVITNIACRRIGKESASEGKGVLAIVDFKAIQASSSAVSLQNLHLLGPNSEEIPARERTGLVEIFPHGSISGVVIGVENQKPIPGARVKVSNRWFRPRAFGTSDEEGKYAIDGVPVGIFDVTAFKSEYLSTTTEVHIKPGKMTPAINLELKLKSIPPPPMPPPERGRSLFIGQPASDFTLKDLNGNSISLSDFKGKPVVLNFWATWCRPCHAEIPHLDTFYNTYRSQGLVVIGVNDENDHDKVRAFAEEQISYIVLVAGRAQFQAYEVRGIPCYYIDKEGIVRYRDVGFGPGGEGEIEEKIRELLQ